MQLGNTVPPMFYNSSVLRKAKLEESYKRLNIKSNDPLLNLRLAKYTNFLGVIQSLGLDLFYCMYWTKQQQIFCKMCNK